MNRRLSFRAVAAAISLVVCLSTAPGAVASEKQFREPSPRERVVRVIRSIQKFFGVQLNEDFPQPPKPNP